MQNTSLLIFVKYISKFFVIYVMNDQKIYILDIELPEISGLEIASEIRENVKELIDVRILGGMEEVTKIKRVGGDNIYLGNTKLVTEREVKNICSFTIFNISIQKDEVVLSGELQKSSMYENEFSYLNLYDMGQKIKVDSIDNSLRLINQGATSAAAELLEYLIGDKKMPNKASGRKKRKQSLDDHSY